MKRVLVLCGVVLLGALAGCHRSAAATDAGAVDAGPAHLSEQEPDNRADQAMAITSSEVVDASLTPQGGQPDEDWYRVSAPEPATLALELSGVPGTKVVLELLDSSQNSMASQVSAAAGEGVRLDRIGVQGPLLVRVTSESKGAGGAYALAFTFTPPEQGFESEPDNRAADATALEEGPDGWQVKGTLGTPGDEDWFRLTLADGGEDAGVDDAGAVDSGQGAAVGLDAGEATLDAGTSQPPSGEASAPTGPAAPDTATPEEAPPPGPLGAVALETQDGGAALLDDGGVAAAQVDAGPPPEPKVPLRIEVSAVPGVKLEVELFSAAEASLFRAAGEVGQPLSLRNVGVRASDTTLYAVVRSAWVGSGKEAARPANPDVPYTLHIQREPEGATSELEPNETLATATPLPDNGFREGFLAPKGDVDLYAIRCPTPELVNLQLSGLERADLQLSVLRPRADGKAPDEVLRANDGDVKEPEYLNSVACSGELYVRVESASRKVDGKWVRDFQNPDTRYRLTATARPDTGAEEREPNNTEADAMPLALGHTVRGTIQPKRDVDDYRLDLSERVVKTAIRATVTPILKVRIGLYLYRLEEGEKPVLVQTADGGKGDKPEVIQYSAEPGVYLLQVRDARNREANFQDAYQLTVEQAE